MTSKKSLNPPSRTEKIRVKSVTLILYPWTHSSGEEHWRFIWEDGGKRRYVTRKSKQEAVKAARAKAREIHNGALDLSALPPEQNKLVRAFLDLDPTWDDIETMRKRLSVSSMTVAQAFAAFMQVKRDNAGKSPHNVRILERRAGTMAREFSLHPLAQISVAELDSWLASKTNWGARTRRNVRSSINTFFRWCQDQDWLPEGKSAAARMAVPIVEKKAPTTYTPKQYSAMLAAVSPEYLPWLAISGLAGVRKEELYPDSKSKKESLQWEHFRWDDGIIILPAEVSKTKRKRVIPICSRLATLLAPYRESKGRITGLTPPEKANHGNPSETSRLGLIAGGWKSNALRHSFISYRSALAGCGQAAREAGNSEAQTRADYEDSKSEKDAKKWFDIAEL